MDQKLAAERARVDRISGARPAATCYWMGMEIVRATEACIDELVPAFARLFPQLSPGPAPSRDHITAMIASSSTFLLLARDPDVVGTLTLTLYPVPVGLQAQINAVVVDHAARGRGIGAALTGEAIRLARGAGAYQLRLTSNHRRQAAHRMYDRLGFQRAESHVFRMTL